jgi:hypothetical protein
MRRVSGGAWGNAPALSGTHRVPGEPKVCVMCAIALPCNQPRFVLFVCFSVHLVRRFPPAIPEGVLQPQRKTMTFYVYDGTTREAVLFLLDRVDAALLVYRAALFKSVPEDDWLRDYADFADTVQNGVRDARALLLKQHRGCPEYTYSPPGAIRGPALRHSIESRRAAKRLLRKMGAWKKPASTHSPSAPARPRRTLH